MAESRVSLGSGSSGPDPQPCRASQCPMPSGTEPLPVLPWHGSLPFPQAPLCPQRSGLLLCSALRSCRLPCRSCSPPREDLFQPYQFCEASRQLAQRWTQQTKVLQHGAHTCRASGHLRKVYALLHPALGTKCPWSQWGPSLRCSSSLCRTKAHGGSSSSRAVRERLH